MASDTGSAGGPSGERPMTWAERAEEMYRLRTVEGLTLGAIGKRFGVGPERVRQLINHHINHRLGETPNPGQLSRTAAEIRREAELARAREHAVELLDAWRQGAQPQQLARTFGLGVRCIRQAIDDIAGDDDRMARRAALDEQRLQQQRGAGAERPRSGGAVPLAHGRPGTDRDMSVPSDLRKAEPVADALLLAAIERAQRHARHGEHGVGRRNIAEHLGFIPGAATTVKLRPQVDSLIASGLIEYAKHHGIELWALTSTGRKQLARARQGQPLELPEAPQHRIWREARAEAAERIEEFRRQLRRTLQEANRLLDSEHGGNSDAWFDLAKRLTTLCELVASATYCEREWPEPDDAHPDHEDKLLTITNAQRARRSVRRWPRLE